MSENSDVFDLVADIARLSATYPDSSIRDVMRRAGMTICLQDQKLRAQHAEADRLCDIMFRGGRGMHEDNDRENWLARLAVHIRERENEVPEDLRIAYWDGYKLAEEGGWLEVDMAKKAQTKEYLQQIIAKQIGFIDGLKDFKPHLTLVRGTTRS